MNDKEFEINYIVKCRMSVTDSYRVCGYARTEEHLNDMVERMKKTWRYVDFDSYRAKVCPEQPTKRGSKK